MRQGAAAAFFGGGRGTFRRCWKNVSRLISETNFWKFIFLSVKKVYSAQTKMHLVWRHLFRGKMASQVRAKCGTSRVSTFILLSNKSFPFSPTLFSSSLLVEINLFVIFSFKKCPPVTLHDNLSVPQSCFLRDFFIFFCSIPGRSWHCRCEKLHPSTYNIGDDHRFVLRWPSPF